MGDVNWTESEGFYSDQSAVIGSDVSRDDWIGYLEALGWMESTNSYGVVNSLGCTGIYQFGDSQLSYMNFINGLGGQLFGVTSKSDLIGNPVAQELAAIMEFSGIPDVGMNYTSKYTAVRSDALRLYQLDKADFDKVVGKTFTISYTDSDSNSVGSHTITLTKAGISAAAHLVGQGKMAQAMSEIFEQCFDRKMIGVRSSI